MLAYCGRPSSASFCDRFPYIGPRYARETIAETCSMQGRPRYGDHQSGRLLVGTLRRNLCTPAGFNVRWRPARDLSFCLTLARVSASPASIPAKACHLKRTPNQGGSTYCHSSVL